MKNYSASLDETDRLSDGPFYKIIRLKTGETLLCITNENIMSVATEIVINAIDPCVRTVIGGHETGGNIVGENYGLSPWMGCSSSEQFSIPCEIILTIGDMNERMIVQYKKYWAVVKVREKYLQEKLQQEKDGIAVEDFLKEISSSGTVKFIDEEQLENAFDDSPPFVIFPPPQQKETNEEKD